MQAISSGLKLEITPLTDDVPSFCIETNRYGSAREMAV
jgi:hypothetical protein